MQSAARTYFQTQVATTTQGDLLIMLFDAALKFLRQAKEKIEEKNYAQKGILISKALDILSELQGTLNTQKGGELADRLQKLYFFCSTRLLAANLKMDITKIDEVMHILTGLREAFYEANTQVATKVVPTSTTQTTGHLSPQPAATGLPLSAALAAYPGVMAQAAPVQPAPTAAPAQPAPAAKAAETPVVTPLAAKAPEPAAPVAPVNIPTTPRFTSVVTPKAASVNRIMAAYAASRAQG